MPDHEVKTVQGVSNVETATLIYPRKAILPLTRSKTQRGPLSERNVGVRF